MRRGRHAARANFTRDLIIMVVGIVVVGAVVFGGLWFGSMLFDGEAASDTTAAPTSTIPISTPTSAPAQTTTSTVADTTTTTAAPTTVATIAPREPSDIVVQVLNAVGTTGLAADVTSELRAAGYGTVAPDDYEPLLQQSQILFRDGFGPEAFELAAFFPDAQVGMSRDMPAGIDLIVLLGSSYEAG